MAIIEKRYNRDIVALDASASVLEAARVMADRRIGSVGVRRDGKIVGLVTERDLVYRGLATGDAGKVTLGEIARVDLPSVAPDTEDREVADVMRRNFTRHALVKEKGAVIGVVSMLDVLQLMLDEKEWLMSQLQQYIKGGRGVAW
jgi:signal-transduction protein with cAMP-binding, CBS, and nucleotidyltransferase domain